jgi:hypothetical protein
MIPAIKMMKRRKPASGAYRGSSRVPGHPPHDGDRDRDETEALHNRAANAFGETVAGEHTETAARRHGDEIDHGTQASHRTSRRLNRSIEEG